MTYEQAKDDVARHVMALPVRQRADFLVGYFNDLIGAMACGRPDLTPHQKDAAIVDFARGVCSACGYGCTRSIEGTDQ